MSCRVSHICSIRTDSDVSERVFDEVVVRDVQKEFADKPTFFAETPFRKTLYLDTDTYVTTPVDDVFELLDSYRIAAAIAPNRATHWLPSQIATPSTTRASSRIGATRPSPSSLRRGSMSTTTSERGVG
jgi:alpha-N-acetylglucosamine transferase